MHLCLPLELERALLGPPSNLAQRRQQRVHAARNFVRASPLLNSSLAFPQRVQTASVTFPVAFQQFALWLTAASMLSDARATRKSVPLILPLAASKTLSKHAVAAVPRGSS